MIDDAESLQISKFECEYRATRREELTNLLLANGCSEVTWKSPEETEGLVLQDASVWKDTVGEDIIGHNNASEIYLEVNDIEAFVEKLARYKEPVEYVTPLASNGLGKKVIRFYDPDGNLIEVGTSV